MACNLTSGYSLGCRDSLGGIQKVFIATWDADTTYGFTGSCNVIDTFTPPSLFYTFEQELETASFIQTGQYSTENGTSFYEQVLEITIQKLDACNREQIKVLGQGVWRVIILDQRGLYWLMGKQNPVRVTAATPQLGKAFADLNGAVITFTGKEPEPAHNLSSSVIQTLLQTGYILSEIDEFIVSENDEFLIEE
jgi:hypothetical protein